MSSSCCWWAAAGGLPGGERRGKERKKAHTPSALPSPAIACCYWRRWTSGGPPDWPRLATSLAIAGGGSISTSEQQLIKQTNKGLPSDGCTARPTISRDPKRLLVLRSLATVAGDWRPLSDTFLVGLESRLLRELPCCCWRSLLETLAGRGSSSSSDII